MHNYKGFRVFRQPGYVSIPNLRGVKWRLYLHSWQSLLNNQPVFFLVNLPKKAKGLCPLWYCRFIIITNHNCVKAGKQVCFSCTWRKDTMEINAIRVHTLEDFKRATSASYSACIFERRLVRRSTSDETSTISARGRYASRPSPATRWTDWFASPVALLLGLQTYTLESMGESKVKR